MPEQIPVIFRACRGPEFKGSIEAFFPTLEAKPGRMACYAHIGQHGEACLLYYRIKTKPAKPEEYADLLSELRGIYERDGDTLKVMRRMPSRR